MEENPIFTLCLTGKVNERRTKAFWVVDDRIVCSPKDYFPLAVCTSNFKIIDSARKNQD